jgi:hypothetical protein
LQDPIGRAYEFAVQVIKINPDAKELQAKAVGLFLQKSNALKLKDYIDKLLLALKSLLCLVEKHPNYEKTLSAKIQFLRHWQGLSDEERKKAIPDERLLRVALQEVSFLNINTEGDLRALVDAFEKENS